MLYHITQWCITIHSAVSHYTVLHHITQCCITLQSAESNYSVASHYTVLHHTTQCCITLDSVVSHNTVMYHDTQCRITLHSAVSHYTVLHNVTQCCMTLHSVVSHYTVLHHTTQSIHNSGILLCICLYLKQYDWFCGRLLGQGPELKIKHRRVRLLGTRLVQDGQSEAVHALVRPGNLSQVNRSNIIHIWTTGDQPT